MKIWSLIMLAGLALAGCAPETRTKNVDVPDTALMELPELGFKGTYTYKFTDSSGQVDEVTDPIDLLCLFKKGESGQNLDYCGFTARVSEEAFSFDTTEYPEYSWFGLYFVEIDGSADNESGELLVDGRDLNDYEYDIDYNLVHTGPVTLEDLGVSSAFANEDGTIGTVLPRTPKYFLDRIANR